MGRSTGMILDGVFASEAIDSSGEIVSIKGMDISTMEAGEGTANYEHKNEDDQGFGRETVGRIIYVKKIFKKEDCEDKRQLDYFKKINEVPYLYGIVRLFDGAGHSGAKDLAAQIRDAVANDQHILVRYSIEGSTLVKDKNNIDVSIAKKVALTLKPCNKTCFSGMMEDPFAPEGYGEVKKNEAYLEDPEYRKLGGITEIECNPLVSEKDAATFRLISLAHKLRKALEAGVTSGAPSSLVGGAALQREDVQKATALAAVRDYDEAPWRRGGFRKFLKAKLPEASDDFLDHFSNIAESYDVRRSALNKSIKDIPGGIPEGKNSWDYTHLLGDQHKQAGYQIKLEHDKTAEPLAEPEWNVKLLHNGNQVGVVSSYRTPDHKLEPHSSLDVEHRGKGLGTAMYEAAYSHAHNHSGIKGVSGGVHTKEATRVHESLSNKHGLGYKKPTGGSFIFGNYAYQLKSEMKMAKNQGVASFVDGKLTTTSGVFEAKLPDDIFNKISNSEAINKILEPAVKNWKQVRNLVKRGIPSEIVSHVVLLSKTPDRLPVEELAALRSGSLGPVPSHIRPFELRYLGQLVGTDQIFLDQHLVRHIFGLDAKTDASKIDFILELLAHPQNEAVLYQISEWYQNYSTFKEGVVPGSWRHWLAIHADEEAHGLSSGEYPRLWDCISPYIDELLKTDWHSDTIPLRTALLHQQYIRDYGEVPATMMYYTFIVPRLIETATHRLKFGHDMMFLAKTNALEAAVIELKRSTAEILGEITSDLPDVYKVDLTVGDSRNPAGRFMIQNGQLQHLEDYHGILNQFLPEGPVNSLTMSRIHGLKFSHHIDVAEHPAEDPTKVPEATVYIDPIQPPRRNSVFDYYRPGMTEPHTIEFGGSGAAIDGNSLDEAEIALIVNNVKNGVGVLRYKEQSGELAKNEEMTDLSSPLQAIRRAVVAGHIHPDYERVLTKHIYEDSMVAGVGNKRAYQDFSVKNRPGVWVSMDVNDLKNVNDSFGYTTGDTAISSVGSALRSAADRVGTGKLFRPGGDEFVAHFPTHEEASRFARHATQDLDSIPPINGSHKISVSLGIGHDFKSADHALRLAHIQKIDPISGGRAFPPGQTPHLAHSNVPGGEGPINLQSETAPTPV